MHQPWLHHLPARKEVHWIRHNAGDAHHDPRNLDDEVLLRERVEDVALDLIGVREVPKCPYQAVSDETFCDYTHHLRGRRGD